VLGKKRGQMGGLGGEVEQSFMTNRRRVWEIEVLIKKKVVGKKRETDLTLNTVASQH